MNIKMLSLASILFLSGCATNDYALYAETQQKIAHAQAAIESARYAALAEIAKQGDTTAKVAAVMSIQIGNISGNGIKVNQVAAPKSIGDTALQWASILLPSLVQVYGISANREVAINQSNNQALVAKNTNDTLASISSNISTSNTAIANNSITAISNVAGSGLSTANTIASSGLSTANTIASSGLSTANTIASSGLSTANTIASSGLSTANSIAGSGLSTINLITTNNNPN